MDVNPCDCVAVTGPLSVKTARKTLFPPARHAHETAHALSPQENPQHYDVSAHELLPPFLPQLVENATRERHRPCSAVAWLCDSDAVQLLAADGELITFCVGWFTLGGCI